jgi:predicted transcriptional regulator
MDNQDFVDFYTKMTILNFKLHKGYKLEKEYEEFYSAVQFLIPVFNNIIKNKNLTLDKVLNGKSFETEMVQTSQKYENIPTIHVQSENDYPFVNEVKPEPVKVQEEEDEADPEGDKIVLELTKKSLEKLNEIQNQGWAIIEVEDSEDYTYSTESSSHEEKVDQTPPQYTPPKYMSDDEYNKLKEGLPDLALLNNSSASSDEYISDHSEEIDLKCINKRWNAWCA